VTLGDGSRRITRRSSPGSTPALTRSPTPGIPRERRTATRSPTDFADSSRKPEYSRPCLGPADAVEATGYDLRASPVAGPPYVVVTSCGPVLRATIDPGRLVIRFDAFEVVRDSDPDRSSAYRRLDGTQLEVSLE